MLSKNTIKDVQDLIQKLTKEFVPPDRQERLRDQRHSLKQNVVLAWKTISLAFALLLWK
jgi:hypothetical protein